MTNQPTRLIELLRAALDAYPAPATATDSPPRTDPYVIVRAAGMGCWAGYLVEYSAADRWAVLEEARHLWRWHSKFVLAEAATYGITHDRSQISARCPGRTIIGDWAGIYECSDAARRSIEDAPAAEPGDDAD